MEWLEHQKQQQLALLQQIEEQKIRLEVDVLKAEMQQQEVKRELEKKDQESQAVHINGLISVGQQQQEAEHTVQSKHVIWKQNCFFILNGIMLEPFWDNAVGLTGWIGH